jgi:hypothetical protein
MLMKEAVIVSATMVETTLNPGESKGFVEEMRFVAIIRTVVEEGILVVLSIILAAVIRVRD